MSNTKLKDLFENNTQALIGASLKCVSEDLSYFTKGQSYKVLEVDNNETLGVLDNDNDKDCLNYLDKEELRWFELVELQKPPKIVSSTVINKMGKDLRKKVKELEHLVEIAKGCGIEVSDFSIDISYQSPIKHF